jgi:hypothetical protein
MQPVAGKAAQLHRAEQMVLCSAWLESNKKPTSLREPDNILTKGKLA